MMPKEVSDTWLIEQIKQQNSSVALTELVNRNTGIYVQMVNSFTYVPKVERDEMIDHRLVNIYNYALDYQPDRNMKISSYIAMRTKWDCCAKIESEKDEINDETFGGADTVTLSDDLTLFVEEQAKEIPDKRFAQIFHLRHKNGTKKMSWKKIGAAMGGLSHEQCRAIHNKNIKLLRKRIYGEAIK